MAGLLIITAAPLTFQASFVILNFYWMLIPGFVIIGVIGTGNLYTNMLPLTLDQMIGALAEELSAAVQWYWWGFNISLLTRDGLKYASFPLHFSQIPPVIFLCLGSLSYQLF